MKLRWTLPASPAARRALAAAALALTLGAAPDAHAQRIKFELWQGLTGDLGERVNDVCKRFNESQTEFEISCISQGSYDEAVQNSIAFIWRCHSGSPFVWN